MIVQTIVFLLLLFTARANTEVLLRTVERFVCVFLSVCLVSPLLH